MLSFEIVRSSFARGTSAAARAAAFVKLVAPGVLITGLATAIAFAIWSVTAIQSLNPAVVAMIMGIGASAVVRSPAIMPGIALVMSKGLRTGIVLLGLQLTLGQVAEVGGLGLLVIVASVVVTLCGTVMLGAAIGVDRRLSMLIAAGTSICGASAILAANTVVRAPREDVAYALSTVTIIGSISMIVYPVLGSKLGLTSSEFGFWAGASIHEVAQVVVAGYGGGQVSGDVATIVKLSRVLILAPVILVLGAVAGLSQSAAARASVPFPWFVLLFLAAVVANSTIAISPVVISTAKAATGILLAMALAGLGLTLSVEKIRLKGLPPLALAMLSTFLIASVSGFLIGWLL